MVEDARVRTKDWIDTYYTPANATDDDGNALGMQCMFANPDYPLSLEFKHPSVIDVIITVDKPRSTPLPGHDQAVTHYREHVPIQIMSVNKTGVTAVKAVWQAEAEIRRIGETYPSGSLRVLESVRDFTRDLGSTRVEGSEYTLNYVRDTT